jgi:DNA-binding CsgD family transcriptional regulator
LLLEAIRHIPTPAFLVAAGSLVAANAAGQAWLDDVAGGLAALTRAGGPDPETFQVTSSVIERRPFALVVVREVTTHGARVMVPACWGLTPREREVAACIARGSTNRQIAYDLSCAHSTVENHITSILSKANVANRASLIAAMLAGLSEHDLR